MDYGRSAILHLVDRLRHVDSWTGRTHIQKSVFLLSEFHGHDLGYKYVLYKHGPYSFDLDAEIEGLRIVGALDYEIGISGYGPRYRLGPNAEAFRRQALPSDIAAAIDEVAATFGKKDVKELECISTLVHCQLHCQRTQPKETLPSAVKACVRQLKPHLSQEEVDRGWNVLSSLPAKV